MGTHFGPDGLYWEPLRFIPWVETALGYRRDGNTLTWGRWFRKAPQVLEQCDGLHGEVMQTVRLKDGTEQVRRAYWLE